MTSENLVIKPAVPDDAGALLRLLTLLDEETEFRAYEPGERKTTTEGMSSYIESLNGIILIAAVNGNPAGYIEAECGRFNRNRHTVHINIAVLKEYQGRGIGRRLFGEIDEWALTNGIHRLDLCVFTYNINAVNLYKSMGYVIEGTKKDSFFVNKEYVDEYIMAKLL